MTTDHALELQPVFPLRGLGNTVICKYIADFRYAETLTLGGVVVEDVKSPPSKTPLYRLKAKLFLDNYGFAITEVMT